MRVASPGNAAEEGPIDGVSREGTAPDPDPSSGQEVEQRQRAPSFAPKRRTFPPTPTGLAARGCLWSSFATG
jgi:hypothetical protein